MVHQIIQLMALIIAPSNLFDITKAFTRKKSFNYILWPVERKSTTMQTVITFSGLSLGYRLCIQSSTSKSRQNEFVTKITGESVLTNLIDLQMFSKQVVHGRGK